MKKAFLFAKLCMISLLSLSLITGCKGSAYYNRKQAGLDTPHKEKDKEKGEEESSSPEEKPAEDSSSEPEEKEVKMKEPGRPSADRDSASKKRRPPKEDSSSDETLRELEEAVAKEASSSRERTDDLGKYDDNLWTGYYVSDKNISIYISKAGKDELKADYIGYSKGSWHEGQAKVVPDAEDDKKAYFDLGKAVFVLKLTKSGLTLDASEAGGSNMQGRYRRSDEVPVGTFLMEKNADTPPGYYAAATFLTAEEVEDFAMKLRLNLLYSNIEWIMKNVTYPFALSGEIIEDEETLYQALSAEDSVLYNYMFLDSIRDCNCSQMFVSSDGIAMGDGYVWFRETVDGDLKIIAINSP